VAVCKRIFRRIAAKAGLALVKRRRYDRHRFASHSFVLATGRPVRFPNPGRLVLLPPATTRIVMLSPNDIAVKRIQIESYITVVRVLRELERRSSEMLQGANLDVTYAQTGALMALVQSKRALTARQLAVAMNLSEVTVGRFAHVLERNGWVVRERDPNDKRAYLLKLTDKAYNALPQLIVLANELLDTTFAGFSEDELKLFAKMCFRIRDNVIDKSEADPSVETPIERSPSSLA
jgi:DNA-binding MarR family transcriptional regulator